eukprot:GHRR01006186.1.p1 GENE.GHRR01006186.1~~GHRR01006186.1.p1  ORF type:complete len:376 (+),score=78.33 GHRR01006186.1:170-1297(+)
MLLAQSIASASALAASSVPFAARHNSSSHPFTSSRPAQPRQAATGLLQPSSTKRQLIAISTLLSLSVPRGSLVCMAAQAGSHNLLIVGPGVLGSYMGTLWKHEFPDSTVTAQTNTETNHERLSKMGLTPITRDAQPQDTKFPYVLFAAPPSGCENYPAAVKAATEQWDGTGSFVFTSSMSVCATEDGSTVTETCPLVPPGKSPSTDKLLGAEQAALSAQGNVLRLVGLYHAQRGPHTFFIKQGEVARYGGYVVNMLHYEDAARMALAILKGDGCSDGSRWQGQVFVGCDNNPLTFQEMVDACFESGQFTGSVKFTGMPNNGGGKGKQVDNGYSRQQLGGWQPKYPSFKQFFMDGGKDYYNTSGLFVAPVGAPHQR